MSDPSPSEVVLDLAVTGDLFVKGVVTAPIIGFIGGLLPAF